MSWHAYVSYTFNISFNIPFDGYINTGGYRGKNSGFSLNKLALKTAGEWEPTHSGEKHRVSSIEASIDNEDLIEKQFYSL